MKTFVIKLKNKKGKAAALCLNAAAMLIVIGLAIAGEDAEAGSLAPALGSLVLACFFICTGFSFGKYASAVLAVGLPIVSLCAVEHYTHVISDLTFPIFLLNLIFFYLLYGLCTFLFGSIKWGYLVATLLPMIFGLANYYVVCFRSSPIVPWDLLSIGTAATVADNYSFVLTWKVVLAVMIFLWIILLASKSYVRIRRWFIRIPGTLVFAMLMGLYITGIQQSEVQSFFGMDTTLFTLNVLYRNNGLAAAFLGNLRFLNVEEPDNYSVQKVQEIETEFLQELSNTKTEDFPTVIVIMDEAFSDLSVWGELKTSEEVLPFFHKMQQEAIAGEVYVSVKGGNTANSEFEFLTGDTMGFLPTGSIPYQQYIHGKIPSLASYLKGFGYETTAIHPYNASGWCRDKVYPYLGFDTFLSLKNFVSPEKFRGYVSDYSAFDRIVQVFEEKEEKKPAFIFEVTMQNHGGYSKENPDFDSYIKLTDVENKTTSILATEKYLTLMNHTDHALERLTTYFESQEEPVILLIFGDHQPSDYITNAVQRICGIADEETLEFVQQGYRVPFLIWSNTGLEHQYYDGISVNYLNGILTEAAGLPLTGYQKYLKELRSELPVINGNVIRDAEGTFYSYGSSDQFDTILNEYQILQYNHLVDNKNKTVSFFEESAE